MSRRRLLTILMALSLAGAGGAAAWTGHGLVDRLLADLVRVAPPRPTAPAPRAVGRGLPMGPGPTAYTVQAQPAPGSCRYRVVNATAGRVLPDPSCTPGATNPKVTPATLRKTICRAGYSASIRPPEAVTRMEKRASARAYSYTGSLHAAEYDHLISLELGGDPNDPRNLWVEPNKPGARGFANPKDAAEDHLNHAICAGRVSLAAAQEAIATNWTTAEHTLGLR
jgi:hypothetical protein